MLDEFITSFTGELREVGSPRRTDRSKSEQEYARNLDKIEEALPPIEVRVQHPVLQTRQLRRHQGSDKPLDPTKRTYSEAARRGNDEKQSTHTEEEETGEGEKMA